MLTIFLIICLSLFLLISHFPLIVPQSLVTHESSAQDSKTPSVSWSKITPSHNDHYFQFVACNLPQIPNELLACCAPHCVSHFKVLDQLSSNFLASLQQASAQCLPHVRKRKTCVLDWNISANKLKQSARFWYRVWLDCGCPSSGVVHQIKRKAKSRYKYEVQRLRRQQLYITCHRIGSALSDACHRDFWKEVRLLRRNTYGAHCNHSSIDGLSSNDDIASTFSSKLQQLLNTSSDASDSNRLFAELNSMIVSSDLGSVFASPAIVVSEALSLLKHGKGDGSNLSSDHFLSCSDVISPFLSQLFTCMIRHGYVPSAIKNCVFQPLLKPGKDPCKSDSYRPIALAPALSKVFERCILIIYNSAFFTPPLQFSFKKGYSTTLCSGLIKNVISHQECHLSLCV